MKIRAVLADDQERARSAGRQIIEKENDIEVIAEAANGEEAIQRVIELTPDVLIMDISMPVLNGLQATRKLAQMDGKSHILILSIHDDPRYIQRAIEVGATGYVSKCEMSEHLAEGIRSVARGEEYVASA